MEEFQNTDGSQNLQNQNIKNQQADQGNQGASRVNQPVHGGQPLHGDQGNQGSQGDQGNRGGGMSQGNQGYTQEGNQAGQQGQQGQGTQISRGQQGGQVSGQMSGQMSGQRDKSRENALMPPVDVIEDSGGITLLADMPGVSKDKLSLHLESDSLTIEGEVALDTVQGMQSDYAEIRVPFYRRTFTLSKELDGEQATAEFKNGVLKLRIPKAAHAQPRKIQIQAS